MSAGPRSTPPGHKSPKKRRDSSPSPAPSRASTQQLTTAPARSTRMGKWSSTTVQQTKSSTSTRLGRKTTAAQTALKLTRSQLETVIYRWNGVKSFDSYGNYWMQNRTVTGVRYLPLYMFDLTSVYENPTGTNSNPFLQLCQSSTTGVMAFTPKDNGATGAGLTWFVEKSPTSATDPPDPFSKSFLKAVSIKLNCWGAKTKAAQYTIQLVKFLDDELVPSHGTYTADLALGTAKRSDFYQNLIKTLTYNPIAQTGGTYRGRMKVLKSETFTLQPNDTSDGDTDPNVKTVSMYVAMNRIISYQESAAVLPTDTQLNENASFAQLNSAQFKPQTRPKARVYLMIRCSNYKADVAESNDQTPSFDLMIRANHQVTV